MRTAHRLTKEQVLSIPKLLETKTQLDIARVFDVSRQSIVYWVARLKEKGQIINSKKGRKSLL